jgi:hypothetical protein
MISLCQKSDMADTSAAFDRVRREIDAHVYKVNEPAYFISNKWFYRFKVAAAQNATFSLPIDNSILLIDGHLKPLLEIPQDMVYVPESAWSFLVSEYQGGPPIPVPCLPHPRTSIPTPAFEMRVFPISTRPDAEPVTVVVPEAEKVGVLKRLAAEKLQVPNERCRLRTYWLRHVGDIVREDLRVADAYLFYGWPLILECQDEKGNWPDYSPSAAASATSDFVAGMNGFLNLGNLCYANSVVQCLLHCRQVQAYYSSTEAQEHVFSPRSPTGLLGKIFDKYWKKSGAVLSL